MGFPGVVRPGSPVFWGGYHRRLADREGLR
jgi:hypothetical protein